MSITGSGTIGSGIPSPDFEPAGSVSRGGVADASAKASFASERMRGVAEVFAEIASGARTLGYNPGQVDPAVTELQRLLEELGVSPGPIDGRYGRMTERAVATFQRGKGLTPTGVVDAETLVRIDEALQSSASGQPAEPVAQRPEDYILFVGMGDDTRYEAKDLRNRGAKVIGAFDTVKDDQVHFGGRNYDLTDPAQVRDFVAAIGIEGKRAQQLEQILNETGSDARDEVAQTMAALARAERGEIRLERMVLSGHSVGDGVWGNNNGFFSLERLESLLEAFPTAAAQVEDFMIAGCYSSSEQHVERFRKMFPNLKTFWAYGDSAPGTWTGAMLHNRIWEEATRGDDYGRLERSLAAGTRKGKNVATWNIEDGYMGDGETRPVAEVRAELESLQPVYDSYYRGETEVEDTQSGPLRDYYRNVQELLGNRALPASERPTLEAVRDQTIRLIFYNERIRGLFQQTYGPQIEAGYRALGLEPPDFSQLSRAEALAQIEAFERQLTRTVPAPQEAAQLLPLLVDGLRDLRRSVIPPTWV